MTSIIIGFSDPIQTRTSKWSRSKETSPCFIVSIDKMVYLGSGREEPGKTSHCFFVSIDKMVHFGSGREEPGKTSHCFFVSIDKMVYLGSEREDAEM